MAEIILLQNDYALIPRTLVRASLSREAFMNAHRDYWRRHGGPDGMCTYRQAFDYLTCDMQEYELPVRYSSYESFKAVRSKRT